MADPYSFARLKARFSLVLDNFLTQELISYFRFVNLGSA